MEQKPTDQPAEDIKPAIHKTLGVRLILGLVAIAALFAGYQWFQDFAKDPDLGSFESTGMVLAIEYTDEGERAVIFTPDGDKLLAPAPEVPQAAEGTRARSVRDAEANWSSDGQRVFLSSNRKTNSYTVHRWNPGNDTVDIKRETSRFQSAPWFDPNNDSQAETQGLILSGGYVLDYNVRTGATTQILPPVFKDRVQNEEGGTASPMDSVFQSLGDSFRKARWAKDRLAMYAIMKGEAVDVAIVNALNGMEPLPPLEIIRGNRTDLTMTPDGRAVITIQGFRYRDNQPLTPEEIAAGGRQKPFQNGIILVDLNEEGRPVPEGVAGTPDDAMAFADTAVSPTGDRIAVVVGSIDEQGAFTAQGLAVMPLQGGGISAMQGIVQGNIRQPSWSPDGNELVYVRVEGDEANIYAISLNTGSERKISDQGRYGMPYFSPQTGASS